MPLSPLTRLGPYAIISAIGVGGMGEVYRASDTKLGRDVALKVLPESLARDPGRMARFQREAQVLASLNHPYIASIYGLEESDSVRALVMELVKGPTLADRIKKGPIPFMEALDIAKQIAEALEYAHEKGVIHRDLKPANVKLTPEGTVKVLDFGLAKATEQPLESKEWEDAPTLPPSMSGPGVILGTAAYMAPEQARGDDVDKRADIWAFGVMLWEMLCGRRMFGGGTTSETLADVLRAELDFNKLPAGTPISIQRLLRRCLERDRRSRLQAIGDARIEIEEFLADPANSVVPDEAAARLPARRQIISWAIAALVFAAVALTLALLHFREIRSVASLVKYSISPPEKRTFAHLAVSPDGRLLAFVASDEFGKSQLFVRELDSLVTRPMAGTEGAWLPFWSPDSRFIGFWVDGKLRKTAAYGGQLQTIGDAPQLGQGSWNRDGVTLYAPLYSPIYQISASGETKALTHLDRSKQERGHLWPWLLPDGRHFLYTIVSVQPENSGIYVGALDSTVRTRLLADVSSAIYVTLPSEGGRLLFLRDRFLWAQPFDAERLQLAGEARQIDSAGEPVSFAPAIGYGYFSASDNGVLAFVSIVRDASQLTWLDRTGKRVGSVGLPGFHGRLRLSPDEKQVVIDRLDDNGTRDLWLIQVATGASTRFTFVPRGNKFPLWSPDGRRIAFSSDRQGDFDLYEKRADGSGKDELMLQSDLDKLAQDWSPDGRFLLYAEQASTPAADQSLWVLPLFGDRKPHPLQKAGSSDTDGAFSPDGKWLAYASNESGKKEIYVRPFPATEAGGKWQISTGGGYLQRWRRDGRELFYRTEDAKMMAVEMNPGTTFRQGVPRQLFETEHNGFTKDYAVTANGQRFLIPIPVHKVDLPPLTVVVNWTKGRKQ